LVALFFEVLLLPLFYLRIRLQVLVDTDYGKAITKMTKHQIVSQAAVAMAGQANAIASTVSSLLEAYA